MGKSIIVTTRDGTVVHLLAVLPPGALLNRCRLVGLIRGSMPRPGAWPIDGRGASDTEWPTDLVDLPPPEQLERLVGRGLTTDMLEPSPAGRVRYVDAAEMAALRFGPNQVAPSIPREPETITQLRHELAAKAAIAEAERADALKGARKEIFIGWADGFLRDIRRLAYLPKIEFGTADLFMLDNLLRDAGYKLPEDGR